jgi:regulatory protein
MKTKEAFRYASALCSRQERCRSEIRQKLSSREVAENDIEDILVRLEKEGYIDEARFALAFAKDKLRFNKWGRVKIRHMLYGKRIPEGIIERALSEIDDKEYRRILREELTKKRKSVRGSNAFDLRAKLLRFGQQRGFEPSFIHPMLDEII